MVALTMQCVASLPENDIAFVFLGCALIIYLKVIWIPFFNGGRDGMESNGAILIQIVSISKLLCSNLM